MNFSDFFEQIELVDDKVIEVLDEIATLREVAKELMLNSYKNATSKEVPKVQEVHSEEERTQKICFSDGSSVDVQVLRVPIYGHVFKLGASKTHPPTQ